MNQLDSLAERALRMHERFRGKIQMMPKCPVRDQSDLALWYTPGVAAASQAIARHPEAVWSVTNRGNLVAIVPDGSRVLGLGDVGPEAALPVMEGKALLFKQFGGVDAVPICLRVSDPDALAETVARLEPSFGGVNLEDIASPKCFEVLDRLRRRLSIPVWHDDQQGTAAVVLAGLLNALDVVGKKLPDVRIALIGTGAANVACYRLLVASGALAGNIVACDSAGILHPGRADIEGERALLREKWRICVESNAKGATGSVVDALRGADVCLAFSRSGPGVISVDAVRGMASGAIVFACANPVPEIWPEAASSAGARIVATGRCDLPNQVNNSLCFPAIFRGALDVGARAITDEMACAASHALAAYWRGRGLSEQAILPPMGDRAAACSQAAAVGMEAQRQGIARRAMSNEQLRAAAWTAIEEAQRATAALAGAGLLER
jgi:malate dehydrogenase (oxaloacetate-decarboxylating)